jgi:hypothetical protein
MMSTLNNNHRLSVFECEKILNKNGLNHSEEEVKLIREWMYHLSEIAIQGLEKPSNNLTENNLPQKIGRPKHK